MVSVAEREWPGVEVVTALGNGRSYGMRSSFWLRDLPGILDCDLWARLDEPVPTRALVTDVGNDILYGASVGQIEAWVDVVLTRLRGAGAGTVVVTGLPIASIETLDTLRFLAFRSAFVPRCRLSLSEVKGRAHAVDDTLRRLAGTHGARFVELPGEWYGFDPIHIRPSAWAHAWQRIVLAGDDAREAPAFAAADWLRLCAARPERQWLAGREQRCPQPALRVGTTPVSLY